MYTPKPLPQIPAEMQSFADWVMDELQAIARDGVETTEVELRPRSAAPDNPREGMIVYADGTNWNPGSGAGSYQYVGGAWVLQRSGPEPNTYGTITDGTTPAPADTAGDTFKLRASDGIKVTTTNDDATHGDNALWQMDIVGISSVGIALSDLSPFADVSNSNAIRRDTIQHILDLIGSLTTDSSPDFAADFVASYDVSASAAKKIALSSLASKVLLSTSSMSGSSSVDISVASGYTDIELRIKGLSTSAGTTPRIRFSENAGSTFLNQDWELNTDSFANNGNTNNNANFMEFTTSSADYWGSLYLFNYTSGANKSTIETYLARNFSGSNPRAENGGRYIASSAAVNLINVNVGSGTFDAGSIELWGIR